jgi:hypothetical protein
MMCGEQETSKEAFSRSNKSLLKFIPKHVTLSRLFSEQDFASLNQGGIQIWDLSWASQSKEVVLSTATW